MFEPDQRRVIWVVDAVIRVYCTFVWHLLCNELKIVHYCLQERHQPSETTKQIPVLLPQLCKKLEKNTVVLTQTAALNFKWWWTSTTAGSEVINLQKLCTSPRRALQYESSGQPSSKMRWDPLMILTTAVLLSTGKRKDVTLLPVSKACQLPFRHGFSTA